jgi:hypothetical protein
MLSIRSLLRADDSKKSRTHLLIAASAMIMVLLAGYIVIRSGAAGFFAAADPDTASLTSQAKLINDATAAGGKAIQFTAPAPAPNPPPPPPPGPTPPPPPPPSNGANCVNLPSACGYPDATNTGWQHTGVTLQAVSAHANGTFYIDQDYLDAGGSRVIDGKHLPCVAIFVKNITIKRSKVSCSNQGMIRTSENGSTQLAQGLLIEDVEFDGKGDVDSTALKAGDYIVRRAHFHHIGSALRMWNNAVVEDSYVANIASTGTSHNAGVPFDCGSNNVLRRNTILMNSTNGHAVPVYNGNPCLVSNITVENNLLAGGNYTLWCGVPNVAPNLQVRNNRFSRIFNPKGGYYGPTANCGGAAVWTNNIWDDTLLPVSP